MGKIRNVHDGQGLPAYGTRVKVVSVDCYGSGLESHSGLDRANKNGGLYVVSGPHGYSRDFYSADGRFVVATNPDAKPSSGAHTVYCYSWEEPEPLDTLDDEIKLALSRAALEAAEKRGYCDETKNILADLGFPVNLTKTVTITVEIPSNKNADDIVATVDGKTVPRSAENW